MPRKRLVLIIISALLLLSAVLTSAAAPPPEALLPPLRPLTWDSGWIALAPNETQELTHKLGGSTDDYRVEMWFKDTGLGRTLGIHTRFYGGSYDGEQLVGAAWDQLTDNTIRVLRYPGDTICDQVRVRITRNVLPAAYESAWTTIPQGDYHSFVHKLGGNPDDYLVSLFFQSAIAGVNQVAYGSLVTLSGDTLRRYGGFWCNLDSSEVRVGRQPNDPFATTMRVTIDLTATPAYDSGWIDLGPGAAHLFTHNLGGDPDDYRVRIEARNPAEYGVHHIFAGGAWDSGTWRGFDWENLSATSIRVYRQPNDLYAQQVRVRIWAPKNYSAYLPIIRKPWPPIS